MCALADTRIAHADHSKDLSAPHLNVSLDDVAAAYKALVGVRNLLSAVLLVFQGPPCQAIQRWAIYFGVLPCAMKS